jgi:proline dehydrogenase
MTEAVRSEGAGGFEPPAPPPLPARVQAGLHSVLREAILGAADSPKVRRLVRRYGMRLGAARFVAGETMDEAVPVLRRLNAAGLLTNTTVLGEHIASREATAAVVAQYEQLLARIEAEHLQTNVALKLTSLGLDLDEGLAYANVERLVSEAAARGNFIRIDMEESRWVEATLRIYRRLREARHDNVGVVLQSYLHRSEDDLRSLLHLSPNVRLVKGAYLEPPEVALQSKADVDRAYRRLLELSLCRSAFTAVATHDDRLIEHAIAFAERERIARERFQFQMLYGVRPQLQLDLVGRGYAVLVATPFGPDWYPYLMRRLAERPANTVFFLRAVVGR